MNLIIDIGNSRTKYYVFKHCDAVTSETEEDGENTAERRYKKWQRG